MPPEKCLRTSNSDAREALKALSQHDYLVVVGALAGLEEQIRYVTVRLMVLREIKEIQKENHKKRRNT
jgi:hypothetical protein